MMARLSGGRGRGRSRAPVLAAWRARSVGVQIKVARMVGLPVATVVVRVLVVGVVPRV